MAGCRWYLVCGLFFCTVSAVAQHTDSRADSVAMRILEASGGLDIWDAVPFLRFDFKLYHKRELVYAIQHLWDKKLGVYRMEMPGPNNEPYVAIFYPDDFVSKVYWGGSELTGHAAAAQMERSRMRYFHDVFFLAAPFLLFEPGVQRKYLSDISSEAEDVLQVTIPHWEGLPSQTFRFYSDRESGRLVRTSYPLPSGEDRSYVWLDYQEYVTARGNLVFSARKRAEGRAYLIETSHIMLPPLVGPDLFLSPVPVLQPVSGSVEPSDPLDSQ